MSRVLGSRARCAPGSAGGEGRTPGGLAGLERPRRPEEHIKSRPSGQFVCISPINSISCPPARPAPRASRLPGRGDERLASVPGGVRVRACLRVGARGGPRARGRPCTPRPGLGRVSGACWEERAVGCGGGHREDAGGSLLAPSRAQRPRLQALSLQGGRLRGLRFSGIRGTPALDPSANPSHPRFGNPQTSRTKSGRGCEKRDRPTASSPAPNPRGGGARARRVPRRPDATQFGGRGPLSQSAVGPTRGASGAPRGVPAVAWHAGLGARKAKLEYLGVRRRPTPAPALGPGETPRIRRGPVGEGRGFPRANTREAPRWKAQPLSITCSKTF